MAKIINLYDDEEYAYVVCKGCGADKWYFICDPNTDPPVFKHVWCTTPECDVGVEIELQEVEFEPDDED